MTFACQILPATLQQPLLPFDEAPLLWPLPEKLRAPHFVDGVVGMLQHMKLVVDDLGLRGPLLDAQSERFPHVDTDRLDTFPLPADQLATKELVQRLLLPLLAKPQPPPSHPLQQPPRR